MYQAKRHFSSSRERHLFMTVFSFLTTPLLLLVGTGALIAL